MPNKLLFIESNTTGTGMIALQKTLSWGFVPLLFTNNPERYMGLKEVSCQVIVCDTNDINELRQSIEKHTKREEICGITTTSDFYLEIVAELNAEYKMRGNSPEAIRTARHKGLTRQTLVAAGIPQPRFEIIRIVQDVNSAVNRIGLPCIMKPADDSASNNVLLVNTLEEAKQHAKRILDIEFNMRGQKTAGNVLVEQYIDAPEYSVEMFTWEGETTCIGITQKSLIGSPYFVESRHIFPAPLPEEVSKQMESTVRLALQAIGIQSGATHTELKWTSEGATIIEINARLAGGMIPELIRLTTGIDILEQNIRCVVGHPILREFQPTGVAGIQFIVAEQEGTLVKIDGIEVAWQVPYVKLLNITAKPGVEVSLPRNAYHRLGHVVVHSPSFEETSTCLQEAVDILQIRLVP